jgi:methanogenic corrinoid protein MtbC1
VEEVLARGDSQPPEDARLGERPDLGAGEGGRLEQIKSDRFLHEAALANVITQTVIPALWSQHSGLFKRAEEGLHPTEENIRKLSALILGPDNADAMEYIYSLRDQGISLDDLHLELVEPTARRLGELWVVDQIDFVAVTVGISRLQRIVHHFADLGGVGPYDDRRRALVMVAPGENHRLGNQIVQKFLKAAGWAVFTLDGSDHVKLIDFVTREWLAVVAISISGHSQTTTLAKMIKSVRDHSLNPHIGVMIGGPMVTLRPELVDELGADGTAANAASAVVLAKKLLAEGLIAEHENKSKDQD